MSFMPERLTAIRTSMKITRAEAARQLNMSPMGYGRYEKGERTPSFQTVAYIAHVFHTSTDYLYGLSDDKADTVITVSSFDEPELYLLVQTAQNNKDMISRLLAYADKLNSINEQ